MCSLSSRLVSNSQCRAMFGLQNTKVSVLATRQRLRVYSKASGFVRLMGTSLVLQEFGVEPKYWRNLNFDVFSGTR